MEDPCRKCKKCFEISFWWGISVHDLTGWHVDTYKILYEVADVMNESSITIRPNGVMEV